MKTNKPSAARDITRITLAVVFIGLMITASLWVLLPFLGATVWATMIVVATWPIMIGLQARLGGRRWLAVTIMTLTMLLLLVVPLVLAVSTISTMRTTSPTCIDRSRRCGAASAGLGGANSLAGSKIAAEWRKLAATPSNELAAQATPYVRKAVTALQARRADWHFCCCTFC